MESAAKLFFSFPRFAVAGASQDAHKFGYKVLAWYDAHSLAVQPITPSRPTITVSSTVYPTLPSPSALPFPTETSLSIITQPSVTLQVLREAKGAGIKAVWLQPGSFDDEGLAYAKREFAAAIGGNGGRGSSGWCILVDGERDGPFKAAPRSAPNHDVQHSTSTTSDPDRPDISLVMELDNSISRFTDNELVFSTKLDLHAGANSHLFQPPRTPSASGSLYQSTASIASGNESSAYTTSRKRSRQDSFLPHRIASYASDGNFWSPSASAQSSTVLTPGLMSPSPLVNTQYILAAGFDTPTATAASALERSNVYATSPDLVFRGGRGWDTGSGIVSDSYFPQASCALAREANGRPRILTGQPPRESWVKTVHSVVGVAGRLWNFCKMNAFHGFYAGGGQGFRVDPFKKTPLPDGQEAPKNSEERTSDYELHTELPSIPGYFPDEDFIPDYMSQTPTSPERPAKKSRHEEGAGDLHANWVMIGTLSASRTSSPTRVSARKVSSAHTSGWKARGKGVKRPILSPSRPLQTSCAGSPALRPDRPASFASARSPLSTPKLESPVSVEAQRHAARRRRQEMEDDAHLKRFNQQLKAMIREGREALGTKIVVEHEVDDMTDEGYAEGDYFDDIVK